MSMTISCPCCGVMLDLEKVKERIGNLGSYKECPVCKITVEDTKYNY